MNAHDLIENHSIHHWRNYRPDITQYVKYAKDNANLILAGHKIEDVCTQFSKARASLIYLEVDDYGQLISDNDNLHQTYIRSKFLFDALANYNYCIDLSWQFLYLYHNDAHFGAIQVEDYYLQQTRNCNYESLKGRLVSVAKRDGLFNHVDTFFKAPLTSELREAYNYIKHRGTYHIEGLGLNNVEVPIGLLDNNLKMISRRSIKLEDWKEKLIQFDLSFVKYFEDMIVTLMPKDFIENTLSFDTLINTAMELRDWEKERSKE